MKEITDNSFYKLNDKFKTRQFGLDFGIYESNSKIVYMLNPTAALILSYLPTGKPLEEIALNIEIAYGFSSGFREKMILDIKKTTAFLLDNKLIKMIKEQKTTNLPEDVAISEIHMTRLPMGYLPPTITGYNIKELMRVAKPNAVFLDTWDTMLPSRNNNRTTTLFSDTWQPTSGLNSRSRIERPFEDVWRVPIDGFGRGFIETPKFLDLM